VIPLQTVVTFWFDKRRGLAMSLVLSGGGLGGLAATTLIHHVITAAGGNWRAGWMVVSATSILCALLALLFVRNRPADLGQVPDGIREDEAQTDAANPQQTNAARPYHSPVDWQVADAVKTMPLWLIILATTSFMAIFATSMAHGVIHLKALHHAPEVAALSIGVMGLVSIPGRLGTGFLVDRSEPRFIWAAALFLMAAGIYILLNATHVTMIYVFAALIGAGFGAAMICMATILGNYYGPGSFASVLGLVFLVGTVAGNLAPYLAGLVFDTHGSYAPAFYVLTALSLLGGIGMLFARPPKLPVKTAVLGGNSSF
jgi:sugar phosphate permease